MLAAAAALGSGLAAVLSGCADGRRLDGAASGTATPAGQAGSHPGKAHPNGGAHGIEITLRGGDAAQQARARKATVEAARRVGRVWGRPPAKVTVIVTRTEREFVAGGGAHAAQVPAVTVGGRIVLAPQIWRRTTAQGLRTVVTHELTHVRWPVPRGVQVPLWVGEGVAELTAYWGDALTADRIAPGLAAQVRAGRGPTGPPPDSALDPRGNADIAAGYEQAWAWCRFLVATRGWPAFRSFVGQVHTPDAPRSDEVFRRVYGTGPAVMAADYRRWLVASFVVTPGRAGPSASTAST